MIGTVTNPNIGSLLSPDSGTIFRIPRYQREYTWGLKNWESLYDDIDGNPDGYFLGSIIIIDNDHNPETNTTELEVIDGQQRLTTLSILLIALYDHLNKFKGESFNPENDEDTYTEYLNLKRRLVVNRTVAAPRLIPQSQNNNLSDYKALLTEYVSPDIAEAETKYAKKRKIYRAYKYFNQRIDETLKKSDEPLKELVALIKKIYSAMVVYIPMHSYSNAYVLFESLNNRGVPLTAVDLIKNSLLAALESSNKESSESYFQQWQSIVDLLGDDYKVKERFFRQSYNAFRNRINKPFTTQSSKYPLGAEATRSNLIDIYDKLIKQDPLELLQEITINAHLYSQIILHKGADELSGPLHDALSDLSHVQGVSSYILLLFLMRNRESIQLTDTQLADICKLLVKFFVRRNLTNNPPTRNLPRLFIYINEHIEDAHLKGGAIYTYIAKELQTTCGSDEEFEAALRGDIYDANPDATRFILASLAKNSITKEMKDLWDRTSSNLYVWSIEHILPQGDNLPDSWVGMIANGDKECAKEYQRNYVHKLGNLTLTGHNSDLGNRPFIEKVNYKDRKGNYIGYKNGLNINDDLIDLDEWTIQNIEERTDKLVKECMDLFRW